MITTRFTKWADAQALNSVAAPTANPPQRVRICMGVRSIHRKQSADAQALNSVAAPTAVPRAQVRIPRNVRYHHRRRRRCHHRKGPCRPGKDGSADARALDSVADPTALPPVVRGVRKNSSKKVQIKTARKKTFQTRDPRDPRSSKNTPTTPRSP